MTEQIHEMLARKKEAYGDAWKLATVCLQFKGIHERFTTFTFEAPEYVHNWVLIMSKLMRILTTPRDPDHWRDIVGYAQLVLDDLTTNEL